MANETLTFEHASARLGDLARRVAPPAGEQEIVEESLALVARAVGARSGVAVLHGRDRLPFAGWGAGPFDDLARFAQAARRASDWIEEGGGERGTPARLALALPGRSGVLGSIGLDAPRAWGPPAERLMRSAAQIVGSALEAARNLRQSHQQGELLAQRNVELETLRDLTQRIQSLDDDREILQTALDMVLEKMGLGAGWILWAEAGTEDLRLAASRGLDPNVVAAARDRGMGACRCEEVFRTGQRLVVRNTEECPRLPILLGRGGEATAHACVPLRLQRGTLGVMNIASPPGHLFSAAELRFLETIGGQVCMAVDRSRTNAAELRRNAENRALVTLAQAIGGSLDERRVIGAVGEYARELLAADRCMVFLGDAPDRTLRFAYLSGPPVDGIHVGQPVDLVRLGARAIPSVLAERRTMVIADARRDVRASADLAARWDIGAILLVPLVAHDRVEGVLLVSRAAASSWSDDETALADALGRQAAVSVENARLYRELQDNMRKLQEAQYGMVRAERLATVGTLASGLAHEVRNPLNSISLQLVLLGRRVAKLPAGVQGELTGVVETIRSEIRRLNALVEEFLSLSSLERLTMAETDPRDLAREVVGLMEPVAQDQAVRIDRLFAADTPAVRMDREKMKQVLINLIRNAIEAMPEGGVLEVRTERAGDDAAIRVADGGVGIPAGTDVFDFFVTTKRGGTGLGLPISRRIVEAHGGAIGFESRPGRGTMFSVILKGRSEARGALEAGSE